MTNYDKRIWLFFSGFFSPTNMANRVFDFQRPSSAMPANQSTSFSLNNDLSSRQQPSIQRPSFQLDFNPQVSLKDIGCKSSFSQDLNTSLKAKPQALKVPSPKLNPSFLGSKSSQKNLGGSFRLCKHQLLNDILILNLADFNLKRSAEPVNETPAKKSRTVREGLIQNKTW